jgi:hypothetical protein
MVDRSAQLIDHVVDINPAKQGHYMAGSGLKVLSPEQSASRQPATIFVMNPNYMAEIAGIVDEGVDLVPVYGAFAQ